jgi:signal transduction histidine kinase
MGEKLSEEQKTYKGMIFKALRDAEMSLDALLEFSRLNTDDKIFTDISVQAIIENTLEKLEIQISESDTKIDIKSLPEKIKGDEKTIIKAFYSLLDNAIKFQPNGQKPHIVIDAEETGDRVIFSIQDNGIGIDERDQTRIFTILRRLHANDAYPGTGLGLSLAKKIAETHGGEIWIESKRGEGTKIFFSVSRNL